MQEINEAFGQKQQRVCHQGKLNSHVSVKGQCQIRSKRTE